MIDPGDDKLVTHISLEKPGGCESEVPTIVNLYTTAEGNTNDTEQHLNNNMPETRKLEHKDSLIVSNELITLEHKDSYIVSNELLTTEDNMPATGKAEHNDSPTISNELLIKEDSLTVEEILKPGNECGGGVFIIIYT